jgi:leucyl/phenylalanyl-tRNA--protein transferase
LIQKPTSWIFTRAQHIMPRIDIMLSTELLIRAYSLGVFPMPDDRGYVGWYQPDPRAVLPLDAFHASRSLQRALKRQTFEVTCDRDFKGVMRGCAARAQTWINDDFLRAYSELHAQGLAHSVEVWQKGVLVGGVYGVHLGGAFFAESKFHTVTGASKVALAKLVERLKERGFALLEVQYLTGHLRQFGVVEIPHEEYMSRLQAALRLKCFFA